MVTGPLISQIVRSGTSVAANYMEADTAITKRDFRFKISLCRKEVKETHHWLRMMQQATFEFKEEAGQLKQEAWELVLIFSSILKG
jgi:four helix bundle protein